MMKRTMLLSATASVLLMISGCSTPVYEDHYAWAEGWRIGKVSRLAPAEEVAKMYGSCRQRMKTDPIDRFAVIKWRQVTRTRWSFARLPSTGSSIAPGDEVYFNAWQCDEPPVARRSVPQK